MKSLLSVLTVVAALGIALIWDSSAQAQYPYGRGRSQYPGFGLYSPNLLGGSPYSLGQIPVPPYFALHPPVYYSYPVPRSYGHSPYAYPGTRETPEVHVESPKIIENHHVQPAKAKSTDDKTAAVTWQVISNPFVTGRQAEQFASNSGR